MLRKVKVTEPGDTALLWGDQVDRLEFEKENRRVIEQGGKPAEAVPVLLGITKASLENRQLHFSCFVPGYHQGFDRGGNPWKDRLPCADSKKT